MRTERVVTKDRDERSTYNIIKRLVDDRYIQLICKVVRK